MQDPIQTGQIAGSRPIDTGRIETMAQEIARRNQAAMRPQFEPDGRGMEVDFEFDSTNAGAGGGGGLTGFDLLFADGTELFIELDTVLEDYDDEENWSIKIPVSGDSFDTAGTITYEAETTRYDGDASADPAKAQNYYRIRVIRGNNLVFSGGTFEEDIFCAGNKGPIVRMIKIA